MPASKKGGYLTLHIQLLNARLFNYLLAADGRALYSAEQGKILSSLWEKEPQTATELAGHTGLANNTLTAMLKRLMDQKLIQYLSHPKDKRKKLYTLTALGKEQEIIGDKVSHQLADIFYQGFSEEEIEQADGYLERILHNLEDGLKRKKENNHKN